MVGLSKKNLIKNPIASYLQVVLSGDAAVRVRLNGQLVLLRPVRRRGRRNERVLLLLLDVVVVVLVLGGGGDARSRRRRDRRRRLRRLRFR